MYDRATAPRPESSRAPAPAGSRSTDASAISRFIGALARATHAFHTYPPGSPARGDVIETVRETLRVCLADEADSVWIDVTNEGLSAAGELFYTDRGPERALALALRKTYVSSLEIRTGASTREFRQFCALMAFPDPLLDRVEELPEILAERGVTNIVAHVVSTHQTIEAGTVPEPLLDLVRRRREAADPPTEAAEGGWIRLDPSVALDRVTLEDLPLLMRDATRLGQALDRMSRSHGSVSAAEALVLHYQEITDLYAGCEPDVSETLFRRMAEVVRRLPEETRLRLLKEEVLPGLVDGRRSGRLLRHFADEEVSDALWLLLDLGVGGVEMLTAGLANLELPEDRLRPIVERVSRRLEDESVDSGEWTTWLRQNPLDSEAARHLQDRLRVAPARDTDFLALRSFDLSVDGDAAGALNDLLVRIQATDEAEATLRCCADILALSADPSVIAATMRRSRGLFFSLESRGELMALADWLATFARVARDRDEHDGEVTETVRGALDQYVTPEFIHRVSALPPQADREAPLVTIICELGRTGVGALVDSLAVESDRTARNRLLTALQPRARDIADHLVDYLSHPQWFVVRNLLTLLGHAGPGYEAPVAAVVGHEHPRVIREALIALARIGTPVAADRTLEALYHESPRVRQHAAEALWRFPPELSHPRIVAVLDDTRLARARPALILDLLEAADRRGLDGLRPILRRLRWHALAAWHPDRRALGWRAVRLLRAMQRGSK